MSGTAIRTQTSAVSIVLPTYNRAKFLPQALGSIKSQCFTDWELIVVDDGSTDNTRELVTDLTRGWPQLVRYHRQENQGAYGARNTGLDLTRGEYIAFFDSDDVWLPHHLRDCVAALERHPEVSWVYGACRSIEYGTGKILSPNTFYTDGKPRAFLKLRARQDGALRIIEDPRAVECMICHGLYNGLQNSVMRREVFEDYRFEARSRNEAEDQLVVVETLAAGRRIAYLDNVHVLYNVHGENSSAVGAGVSVEKHLRIIRALVEGYERLGVRLPLTRTQKAALNRRLKREYFWNLGYVLFRQPGREQEAFPLFRRGLRLWPWDLACWKTYLLARLRVALRGCPRELSAVTPNR